MRTLVITGAGGYIGRHLVAAARAAGWHVVAAARQPVAGADAWLSYRLEDERALDGMPRDAVIVHLAAQTGAVLDADIDIRAADRLLEAASRRSARIVFVSSQTARPEAPTSYGRTKWAIERRLLAAGGIVVRPGLVYGGSPGGVYATLLRLVKEHPVLPRLFPSPQVQPVHVEDLAQALLHAATQASPTSLIRVGAAEPIALDSFLRALAQGMGRAQPRFIPLPAELVPLAARILDAIGKPTLAMRMRSLVDLPRMEVDDATITGVTLRPLQQGVARGHPRRRHIALEGATMLRYALGERAPVRMLLRYVRYVERMRDAYALTLPAICRACPATLRALDHKRWLARWPELDARFGAAIAIAEASPEGARRFLRLSRTVSVPVALLRVAGVGLLEGTALLGGAPLRALARPEADG